jgi:hypothetical protein
MPVYEVLLRFRDREELRVTDKPLEVGSHVQIAGADWLVESHEAKAGGRVARYTCVELRERSASLRAISSDLLGQAHELRDRPKPDQPD